MFYYRLSGQDFYFPDPLPELELFERKDEPSDKAVPFVSYLLPGNEYPRLVSRTKGWVAGSQRLVEVYEASYGFLLKVADYGECLITPHGETIVKKDLQDQSRQLNGNVILGPALILALALRGVWSLHASAVLYKENLIVFLGESGQGKSTLAAYLSQSPGWRLVADDILPVKIDLNGVNVLPHFPQLKLPMNAQPAIDLPENLPLKTICVLTHAEPHQMPELQKVSSAQAVRTLLSHIAGTRMFNAALLAKHLDFSAQVAKQIPAYQLINPHRRDTLPLVKEFLEKIC